MRNGDDAYPAMLAAIDAAEKSVGLCSYIFRDDEAGMPFIEALIRAHRRGVQVRVLIDGIGGGYFWSGTYQRLHEAGVPVDRFLHSYVPWKTPFLNLRNHRKLMVVDGRIAFTGGINIGHENLLATNPAHPVRDTHFRLEGPVVEQLTEAFADDWLYETGEKLLDDAWFPDLQPVGEAIARVVTSGPDEDLEQIEFAMLHAISCARRSIRVVTPYFLPPDMLTTALGLAAMRGVTVDIVVPENSNHTILDWARRAPLRILLEAGCRVWLLPPPFDHSKLMTIDDAWSLIGSANWDIRSFRLNFELNVEIQDEAFARSLAEVAPAGRLLTLAEVDSASLALQAARQRRPPAAAAVTLQTLCSERIWRPASNASGTPRGSSPGGGGRAAADGAAPAPRRPAGRARSACGRTVRNRACRRRCRRGRAPGSGRGGRARRRRRNASTSRGPTSAKPGIRLGPTAL